MRWGEKESWMVVAFCTLINQFIQLIDFSASKGLLASISLKPNWWHRDAFNVHYSTSESWNWKITIHAQLNTFIFFPRKDLYNWASYLLWLFASWWIWYFRLWLVTNIKLFGNRSIGGSFSAHFCKIQVQNHVSFINTGKHFTEKNGLGKINWCHRLVYFYYIHMIRKIIGK